MKLGLLFGAGAEFDYNMPSGQSFALNIFRQDTTNAKEKFKEMREQVNAMSRYAAKWLPEEYQTKNISSFGKSVFEGIIKDTIEHNRDKIVANLNSIDNYATFIVDKLKRENGLDVNAAFEHINGVSVSDISMKHSVAFIDVFAEGNRLFDNAYFSALLQAYRSKDELSDAVRSDLRKIIVALLQLQIGALGEKLSKRISDNLFAKKIDDVDIFDDLGELFQLNYRSSGVSGLEYLLDFKETDTTKDEGVILKFAQDILENVFANVLDYKTLIDSNWHYLYYPSSEWAKFCKISIFLLTVQEYIDKQAESVDKSKDGYYGELREALESGKIEVSCIATTNYTKLISDVLNTRITYLNGSTSLWYDPYVNRIGAEEDLLAKENHIIVPLLFTQSGTKPITAIDMSIKYVQMYESFRESDAICCIGFGFNPDDEHINGVIRALVDEGKKLIVIRRGGRPADDVKREVADNLKLRNTDNIEAILVDGNRCSEGVNWIDRLLAMDL